MGRVAFVVLWLLCAPLLAREVYVSTDGDDTHAGTRAAPLRTIGAAVESLQQGDRLLLRRGDAWREPLGVWTKSNVEIAAYGEGPRPRIDPGNRNGFEAMARTVTDVSLVGIALVAESRGPHANPAGIRWLGGGNLLIEDCLIDGFATNVIVMGCDNVTIRRNVIRNAYPLPGAKDGQAPHSQGIFVNHAIGLRIEDNVVDRNGWHPTKRGAEPTWFNHNIYVSEGSAHVVIRNNILSRTAGFGIKCTVAATVEDNLFYRCPLGFSVSYRRHPVGEYEDAVIRNNVVLHSNDIERRSADSIKRGNGLGVAHLKKVAISGNIFGPPDTRGDVSQGVSLSGTTVSPKTDGLVGLEDVEFTNNIVYGYDTCLSIGGDTFGDVLISDNVFNGRDDYSGRFARVLVGIDVAEDILDRMVFRDNTYHHKQGKYARFLRGERLSFAQWVALTAEQGAVERRIEYPNPYITPHEAVGLSSFDDLLAAAEAGKLSAQRINEAVRRKGFGLAAD